MSKRERERKIRKVVRAFTELTLGEKVDAFEEIIVEMPRNESRAFSGVAVNRIKLYALNP